MQVQKAAVQLFRQFAGRCSPVPIFCSSKFSCEQGISSLPSRLTTLRLGRLSKAATSEMGLLARLSPLSWPSACKGFKSSILLSDRLRNRSACSCSRPSNRTTSEFAQDNALSSFIDCTCCCCKAMFTQPCRPGSLSCTTGSWVLGSYSVCSFTETLNCRVQLCKEIMPSNSTRLARVCDWNCALRAVI